MKKHRTKDLEWFIFYKGRDNMIVDSNSYLTWAFLGCLLFGSANFLAGVLSAKLGLAGAYPFFMGSMMCWLFYHITLIIKAYMSHGHPWRLQFSAYYSTTLK